MNMYYRRLGKGSHASRPINVLLKQGIVNLSRSAGFDPISRQAIPREPRRTSKVSQTSLAKPGRCGWPHSYQEAYGFSPPHCHR